MTIHIKKTSETAKLPSYANPNDAGMDFYANESMIVEAGERKLISTGIAMAIPQGHVGLIWDKSAIATIVPEGKVSSPQQSKTILWDL